MTLTKTVKEQILEELEDSSSNLLEEFLDFILFIKQRHQPLLTQPKQEEVTLSSPKRQSPSQIKALKEWFENTENPTSDFDPDQAKEDSSSNLLEEFLDFILFIKQRHQPSFTQPKREEFEPPFKSKIKAFEGLFDQVSPISEDVNPDQAKWEYLKEKHNL
jgi:hypothetical protein